MLYSREHKVFEIVQFWVYYFLEMLLYNAKCFFSVLRYSIWMLSMNSEQLTMYNWLKMSGPTKSNNNIVQEKSFLFAKRIVRMYQHLSDEKKEFVLSKQVLRSGTSIGANIEEAIGGSSKRDFKAKLNIAYKEARETKYWIRLLRDTDYITKDAAHSILIDCEELLKLLYTIIQSSKK